MTLGKHPMSTQVGGDHYRDRGVQPLEATYLNYGLIGLEAAVYTKVNKYFRTKGGMEQKLEDIQKAQHCLSIYEEKIAEEIAAAKLKESMERNR